jgi:phospholipid-binding lipoprotein MlaA
MLPILGPSTLRDAGGLVVDGFVFDPWPYMTDTEIQLARRGTELVDTRYRLGPLIDELEADSLDFYVAVRSAFLPKRAARISKNGVMGSEAYESIFEGDFDDDFDDDFDEE